MVDWLAPLLTDGTPPSHEPGYGYGWESPVWPRLPTQSLPERTVVTETSDDVAWVVWVDDSVQPQRVRFQRMRRDGETRWVHDGWVDPQ